MSLADGPPFRLVTRYDGTRIVFDLGREAGRAVALPMAPSKIEDELRVGLWLILVVAAWSGPDRRSIPVALNVARLTDASCHVGVRPLDEFAEIAVWCPGAPETTRTPVWLVLKDGQLIEALTGAATPPQILDLLDKVRTSGERDTLRQVPLSRTQQLAGLSDRTTSHVPELVVAVLRQEPEELERLLGIHFVRTFDELDTLRVAVIEMEDKSRIALIRHDRAPVPGTTALAGC